MFLFFQAALILITIVLLIWGFLPYFRWKHWSRQPTNNIVVVTKDGKESLADYIQKRRRENATLHYTIVVPAYNEEKRLPNMIPPAIEHFERMGYKYEIIVVNDSSTDKTTQTALKYSEYNSKKIDIKVIEYELHQGKGGAVRIGCAAARGEGILMADADGATDIRSFEKLVYKLREIEKNGHGIAAGSRRLCDKEAVQKRFGHRVLLSKCSNFVVQNICGVKLKDTQCGFKLFTKKTAVMVFSPLHIRTWAFDVELFVIANMLDIPYAETAVHYTDQEDSKLNVLTDSIQMARDFLLIKLFYVLKIWRPNHTDKLWEGFCIPSQKISNNKSLKA